MRDKSHPHSLVDIFGRGPETVGIEFAGRLFVWHAFPTIRNHEAPSVGHEEWGPTVTVVVEDEDDEGAAADDLQRFLTALAFWLHQPAEAVSFGSSGESDPFHPAIHRALRTHVGWMLAEPPAAISMRREPRLRVALAYFREALNAGSPFYRFLAFWNSLEAAVGMTRDSTSRDRLINSLAERVRETVWDARYPFPPDLASALRDDSRHAIAHVLRDPGGREIDPDRAADRVRITSEADALSWITENAIKTAFPDPVTGRMRQPAN